MTTRYVTDPCVGVNYYYCLDLSVTEFLRLLSKRKGRKVNKFGDLKALAPLLNIDVHS